MWSDSGTVSKDVQVMREQHLPYANTWCDTSKIMTVDIPMF